MCLPPPGRLCALAYLTRTLLALLAPGPPYTQCVCILDLIPPIPRLLVLSEWKALYPTLFLPTLMLNLRVLGSMVIAVVEARMCFRALAVGICRMWRIFDLHPKALQIPLFAMSKTTLPNFLVVFLPQPETVTP